MALAHVDHRTTQHAVLSLPTMTPLPVDDLGFNQSESDISGEPLKSTNLEDVTSLAPTLAYVVLLMVAGLVGNTLVFLVYYRRFKPSVTRTYILAMSVCDLITNALVLPADILTLGFAFAFTSSAMCKLTGWVTGFTSFLSACILVAVAVDRYRRVCRPTERQKSVKDTCVTLVLCAAFASVASAPLVVLLDSVPMAVDGSPVSDSMCVADEVNVKPVFLSLYSAFQGLGFVACVAIMVVSYGLIARQIRRHTRHVAAIRHAARPGQRRRRGQRGNSDVSAHETARETGDTEAGTRANRSEQLLPCSHQQERETFLTEQGTDSESEAACSSSGKATEESGCCSKIQEAEPGIEPDIQHENEHGADENASPDECSTGTAPTADSESINLQAVPQENGMTAHQSPKESSSEPTRKDETKPKPATMKKAKPSAMKAKSSPITLRNIPARTTVMMFVLTATFVVNYLPYLIVLLFDLGDNHDLLEVNVHAIAYRSFFINSAINALVYSFCNVRFRRECRHLLSRGNCCLN